MAYPEINSEETFGTLKAENAELREALERVWEAILLNDILKEEEGYPEIGDDNDEWRRVREICFKYKIPGKYVHEGSYAW